MMKETESRGFEEVESLTSPDSIPELQQGVRDSFSKYFTSLGLVEHNPAPLVYEQDKSVLFTNATVIPFKRYIENGQIPIPGFFVDQPCLRFQNLKRLYDPDFDPEYMSYFRMLGILTHPGSYASIAPEIWRYLTETVGLKPSDIKIYADSNDKNLISNWNEMTPDIELNSKPQGYYEWEYGMDNIRGKGLTFSVRQEDGRYKDLGNVIEVLNTDNGQTVAHEFGFGVETLLARKYNLHDPFEAGKISMVIPYSELGVNKKLQDVVACLVMLYGTGVESGRGKRHHIAKKMIQALYFLAKNNDGVNDETTKTCLQGFEKIELGSHGEIASLITDDLHQYAERVAINTKLFEDYVRNQKKLIDEGKVDETTAMIRMKKLASERYYLEETEQNKVIQKYFGTER